MSRTNSAKQIVELFDFHSMRWLCNFLQTMNKEGRRIISVVVADGQVIVVSVIVADEREQ